MKRILILLFLSAACSGMQETPGLIKGRLVLDVEPNPLIARPAGEDLYEFSFNIIMREEGGVDVRIENFTVEAIAFKTLVVQAQTFPASFITDRGYPAEVGAGKYLRFEFVKRWSVPARLLLSGAAVRVTARTIDRDGRRDVSQVRIPVRVEE